MAPTTCTSKWRCPRVRLAASRTLANASGRMSSSVSPSPSRRRNSLVFAASASSESSSTSGSNVLTMAALSSRRFSLRFSLICVIFPRTTKDAPYDGGLNESIIRATSFNTSARLRPSDRRDIPTARGGLTERGEQAHRHEEQSPPTPPSEQRVDREGPERGEDARTGPQERLRCGEEHGGSANEPGLLWGAQDLDGLRDGGPAT